MLKLSNIKKSFGTKVVIDGFSYSFSKGVYLVRGESGVGKTTLLRIIAGLDTEYSGSVEGGGFDNVSMSFQEYRLFPSLTALDNLTVTLSKDDPRGEADCIDLLSSLGFSKDEMRLFPSEMSGGMNLRVSIARALLKDCPVLLLDEPTRELDPDNVNLVLDHIESEGKRRTVIVVTHDDLSEKLSDHTLISL